MKTKLKFLLSMATVLMLLVGITGVALAASVIPTLITGANNDGKDCADVIAGSTELRVTGLEGAVGGNHTDGTLSVTVTQPSSLNPSIFASFDWTSNITVLGVVVKDGIDGAYFYDYRPGGSTSDTNLTTPGPTSGGTYKNISHINFCYIPPTAVDLAVTKTADASFTHTFDWTIDKSADKPTVYSAGGDESEAVTYTVDVTKGEGTDGDFAVSGSIFVNNPNSFAVNVTGVSDALAGASVDCGVSVSFPYSLAAGGTLTCSYSASVADASSGTNTATATWEEIGSSHTSASGSDGYSFGDPTLVNDCVTVSDPLDDDSPRTFCKSDSFSYSATFTDPAGTCTEHNNVATLTGDNEIVLDTDDATVEDCQGANLTVDKTAAPSFDLDYTWEISKSVDRTNVEVVPGGSATFNYTVLAAHDGGTASNWEVNGTITVSNPNDWKDVTLDSLADIIDNGGVCTVDPGPYVVPMATGGVDGTLDVGYTCTYASAPDPADFTNTATATWDGAYYHTPDSSADGTASDAFGDATNVTNECTTVNDSNANGPQNVEVCVGDEGDVEGTFTFNYSVTFSGPALGTCEDHANTATSTPNDDGATDSADASVRVCTFRARLTPGYWKTHLALNGTTGCSGLPSGTGCSANGPFTKTYLPQSLGTSYNVLTIKNAADVFAKMNCSNTGSNSAQNQNAMGCLAGHLLAAKLNVANGANTCIAPTITAAEALLSSIPYTGPTGTYTSISLATRNAAIALKNTLDAYNNGTSCP